MAVNSWHSVMKVRDKVRRTLALSRRRLPVPPTFLVHRPGDLAGFDRRYFPLVLKPFQGDNGRGIVVVRNADRLATLQWPEEMVLAQPFLDVGGTDLKLYAVDGAVWATNRTDPVTRTAPTPPRRQVRRSGQAV